jgi:hypothetical protein
MSEINKKPSYSLPKFVFKIRQNNSLSELDNKFRQNDSLHELDDKEQNDSLHEFDDKEQNHPLPEFEKYEKNGYKLFLNYFYFFPNFNECGNEYGDEHGDENGIEYGDENGDENKEKSYDEFDINKINEYLISDYCWIIDNRDGLNKKKIIFKPFFNFELKNCPNNFITSFDTIIFSNCDNLNNSLLDMKKKFELPKIFLNYNCRPNQKLENYILNIDKCYICDSIKCLCGDSIYFKQCVHSLNLVRKFKDLDEHIKIANTYSKFDKLLNFDVDLNNLEYLDLGDSYDHNIKFINLKTSNDNISKTRLDKRKSLKISKYIDNYIKGATKYYEETKTKHESRLFVENLKYLVLGNYFNSEIIFKSVLDKLTHLTLGKSFDQQLDLDFLPNLEWLKIGDNFNSKIKNLPKKLIFLFLGNHYNQELDLKDNLNLKFLELGDNFNKNIRLNNNILFVKFGDKFNKYIALHDIVSDEIVLPESLVHIEFGDSFNKKIKLNKNLTHLILGNNFNQYLEISENLEYLMVGNAFNHKLEITKNLTWLRLGNDFNQVVIVNPNSTNTKYKLHCLEFGNSYNHNIDLSYFNNLVFLKFGSEFNHPVNLLNLIKLKYLIFGREFNKQINLLNHIDDNILSNYLYSLEYLEFGDFFNKPLELNHNLKHLKLGRNFNNFIKINENLIKLEFGFFFNKDFKIDKNIDHLNLQIYLK